MTRSINSIMKRLLLLALPPVALAPPVDMFFKGYISYASLSALFIGIRLSITVGLTVYTVYRWDSELQTLMLVELKKI